MKRSVPVLVLLMLAVGPIASRAEEGARVGTTFSQVQCEYLDLDWRRTYEEVLGMGFDVIRLGAYWSRIEKSPGEFDFEELDWQIKKAAEKGVRILLTVGMKAPRWPEYFIPEWLTRGMKFRFGSAVSDHRRVREGALEFIRRVVDRYKDEPVIMAWQAENEPLSRAGPRDLWIRSGFLKDEIALIRDRDTKGRPVVVSAMAYPNGFLRFLTRIGYTHDPVFETIDIGEVPALDIYSSIGQTVLGRKICFITASKGRLRYLSGFVARARSQNKRLWITELQAEPWEPGELVHKDERSAVTCGADTFKMVFEEARSLGIDTIFLWGVEYWIFREQTHKDPAWLEAANELMERSS